MAGQRRVQISLPDEVYAWYIDLAIQNYTTPQQEMRRMLIEIYAYRYGKPIPPTWIGGPHLVYFVQHPETRLIKVGATSNFNRRFSQLQTETGTELEVLGMVHFEYRDEAFAHEQAIKSMFKKLKVKGEWFQATPYLLEFVRRQAAASTASTDVVLLPTGPTSAPTGTRPTRSGYKGVYAYGKRWEAVVYANGRRQRLGVYDTPDAAARAYDDHLVAQTGDPNAAVNFPGPADATAAASAPFIEQFASGRKLTDIEWKQWQQQAATGAALDAPLSVKPDGPPIDASTPLIDRPAKSLYRREPTPIPTPTPRPDPDDDENLS